MNVCTTMEIREKEVINLCDGMRLGCVSDFEIDICDAKIVSLILPAPCGFFGFAKGDPVIIPWNKVECIGEDAILVRLNPDDVHQCPPNRKKGGWFGRKC